MPNFQVISKTTHAEKNWKRYSDYDFASRDVVVPIVAQEMSRALLHLPIGFILQDKKFIPVAVLGLEPGQNLFVSDDGHWIGGYVPAAFRSYPFKLTEMNDGQQVLVIDENSGLITSTEGEPFFDEEGNPAKALKEVLDFLVQVQGNHTFTERICGLLVEHQLIKPWTISAQTEIDDRNIEGLYQINEGAINEMAAEDFESLRQAGALPLVYCQLLSMQNLQTLIRIAETRRKAAQPVQNIPAGDLDFGLLSDSGTISFGP